MNWILFVLKSISIGCLSLYAILFLIDVFKGGRKEYVKKVPYTRLINEVMSYNGGLLNQHGIKYYPKIEIRYYKNKKYAGLHFPEGRIIIYTKSHTNVIQIVNTALHEMGHHIQLMTDYQEYKKYSDYQKVYKWEDNPCEKFACEYAKKNLDPCLAYLVNKGIIELQK